MEPLTGHHFNLPIDAWFHFEFAVESLVLVVRDDRIFAFRQI